MSKRNIQLIRTFDATIYAHPHDLTRADQILRGAVIHKYQVNLTRGFESLVVSQTFFKQHKQVLVSGGYRTVNQLRSVE